MEIQNGLDKASRQALGEKLYHVLADTYAIYLKTQQFHWNIRGRQFYAWHLMFEKQYEELASAIDELAERIRALGLFVDASFQAFHKASSIKDEGKLLTAEDMVYALLCAHESLSSKLRELGDAAGDASDHATVDLIGRRLGVHEKFSWMLRESLA